MYIKIKLRKFPFDVPHHHVLRTDLSSLEDFSQAQEVKLVSLLQSKGFLGVVSSQPGPEGQGSKHHFPLRWEKLGFFNVSQLLMALVAIAESKGTQVRGLKQIQNEYIQVRIIPKSS